MVERVLHVDASPRSEDSVSTRVAKVFLAALAKRQPLEVDRLDPWECDLPEAGGDLLAAIKYAKLSDEPLAPDQAVAWDKIRNLAERFHRADTLLFSVPLWNWGLPYKLKHLIDAISHKGLVFTFDERGLNGMLGGRRAVAIYARGLGYGPESQTPDHAWGLEKTYLEAWLRWVGIEQVQSIVVENTLAPVGAAIRAEAENAAALLAQSVEQDAARTFVLGRNV